MNEFALAFSKALPESFYERSSDVVARELLGKYIVKKIDDKGFIAGRIIETEAYLPAGDEASHAYKGKTARNAAMFAKGGVCYVYMIYGLHFCFNVVTDAQEVGSAVLIRAVKPVLGLDIMSGFRNTNDIKKISSGPANFAKAFNFRKSDSFKSLITPDLYIQDAEAVCDFTTTPRIGITKSAELPLRFLARID